MSTLLPDISDALTVHDAAHREQSAELHGVALKMLTLCGQTHICTDGLDEKSEETEWDRLPGCMRVDDEAAALVGDEMRCSPDMGVLTSLGLNYNHRVQMDKSFQYKTRTPAYELWLVRKESPEEVVPDCPFKVGDYVPVGWPRKHGAYKFPVVAQKVEAGHRFLQVHKDGENVQVFDKNGDEPSGLADLIDTFVALDYPEQAIVETVYVNGQVQFFDVLMLEGIDCTKLPYRDRDRLFGESLEKNGQLPETLVAADTVVVMNEDGLPALERGTWIVRYQDEVLSDLTRVFWFEHRAGEVVPGTVLPWVKPSKQIDDVSGYIQVVDTGLPPLQIHKSSRGVSIFVAEGGRNRSNQLSQIVEMVQELPEDTIIEAMWTCVDGDVPVSVERVQNSKQDLSKCQVTIRPYDIVLWGAENLSERPMYERTDLLEQVVGQYLDGVEVGVVDSGEKVWAFEADAGRPLTGDCSHCFGNG